VFIEAIISMALIAVIATAALTGDRSQLRHVAQSLAETKAWRLAAMRLALLQASTGPIAHGEREFALEATHVVGLPQARGLESVRDVAAGSATAGPATAGSTTAGLVEVEVVVSWLPTGAKKRRRVELTRWFDRRRVE
jgi:hypothetical protein